MSAELCINITDDNELEDDETFNLTINRDSDPEIILVDAGQAMVTILDDECKHINCVHFACTLIFTLSCVPYRID